MEIAIVAKAKQGYIYRYLREHNMSNKDLAEALGTSQVMVSRILNFRWLPGKVRKKNDITERLERFFSLPIDFLFPPEITKEIVKRLGRPFVKFEEVDLLQVESVNQKYLSFDPHESDTAELMDHTLTSALSTLTPREETCLRLRHGIGEGAKP